MFTLQSHATFLCVCLIIISFVFVLRVLRRGEQGMRSWISDSPLVAVIVLNIVGKTDIDRLSVEKHNFAYNFVIKRIVD